MIRTLSCHCGKVRLECNAPLGRVVECNCNACARAGYLSWRVKHEQVRLVTPSVGMSSYVWRFADSALFFCPTCGTAMWRTAEDNYFTLNARCLDGVDIFTLDIERYDGLADMPGGLPPPLPDA
jgi:hypothetical protein